MNYQNQTITISCGSHCIKNRTYLYIGTIGDVRTILTAWTIVHIHAIVLALNNGRATIAVMCEVCVIHLLYLNYH